MELVTTNLLNQPPHTFSQNY